MQTLWKRDVKNKYVIIPGEYSKEEFANIKLWRVSEKIDGTNVRIELYFDWLDEASVDIIFKGRTDNAQIHTFLLAYLQKTLLKENILPIFEEKKPERITLFGEGYGPKVQKGGGLYRKDVSFILFDVGIDGWWLKAQDVQEIAEKLDIDCVPEIGLMCEEEIVRFVKSKPQSILAQQEKVMEGVVCRSEPLMLFRNGNPLMFKLKIKDYEKLERFGGKV